ncbi:RNB domain-containing ribonuclease, partial [Methylibium petroleiphilum]
RVHEGPTPEKRAILQTYLRALGLGLSIGDDPRPGEFQAIAQATKDRPDATQIHSMLLRSMQQAIYTPTNSGHFGLAYPAYTHFTSPIRRYPDLLVHRVIKALLGSKKYHLQVTELASSAVHTRKVRPTAASKAQQASKLVVKRTAEAMAWEAAGAHCSANERRADEASRDVEAWLKCKFMREHLGEEFGGAVTAVTTFGLFVTLDELYVEGLVHITELGGEYFRFDEARQELRGERTGVRYVVGSRVRVQVSRVDLDGRKIDFRLVHESGLNPRAPRDKAASAVEELQVVKDVDREHKRATKKAVSKTPRKPARSAGADTAAAPRKSKRSRR